MSPCKAPDVPLDVLGAESEGQIGYLLETALSEALPDSEVCTGLHAGHLHDDAHTVACRR